MHERPLVIVPPNINKFYILDLQPENSFVRHAVEQGYTVFLVSWRNPVSATPTASIAPLVRLPGRRGAASAARGQRHHQAAKVNALGFCVGGTMLASALALAEARGEHPVASLTLLTTLLDFHDTGVLKVFVDEAHALLRDHQFGSGGLMPGRDLATTFSFLRPNELVWNYVVGNYLKGQKPPAFDLLFWNGDSTNLPGRSFPGTSATPTWKTISRCGRAQAAGLPLDLTRLTMPAYIFGSREDHIVPWTAAYASTQLLRGPQRFVLGASGHIAGVVNPPAKKRRSYWVMGAMAGRATLPGDPNAWLAQTVEQPGSWWPDWSAWLAGHSGKQVKARVKLGNASHRPIEPAPGRYVKVRRLRPRSRLVRSR